MASLHAGRSTGRLRVYTPAPYREGSPCKKEREQDRRQLLVKIQHHYEEALKRLTGGPDAGVCVGLLDPVSNIILSALLATDRASAPVDPGDAERRSLDGLVTFLTCFFPYLADWEAVRYLLLAEADPLVAARIVAEDRGTKCFRPDSAATSGALKLALRCAAVAAKQPQLTDAWLSLSSSIDKAVPLLAAVQPNYHHNIFSNLNTLFTDTAHLPVYPPPTGTGSSLIGPWELAGSRRTHTTKVPHHYQHSWSLRRVLLDTIHGFYLKALARMPRGDLRSRYSRSMLKAGHCYGPFDPVSNIIVNTIWYEACFPPLTRRRGFDFVGTWSLMRIEAQSFYGLLSFICTCYQDLSMHEAMRILLDTDLNLAATKHCSSVQEEQQALGAAASAAWYPYPSPDAQVGFLSSCNKPQVLSLLSDHGGQQQLSSQAVQQLATLLSSGMVTQQQQPVVVSEQQFSDTMTEGIQQRRAHKRISRKVKDALRRYEKLNSEHNCYQLHVVCGANESVSGPDNSMKRDDPYDDDDDDDGDYYHHMHANFLVTRNVGSECSVPILFFAELSKDGDDDEQLLCCPVDIPPPGAEPVRCLFCEHEGIRIVHPANYPEGFHGRTLEFEKMVRGEEFYDNGYHPEEVYSNYGILRHSELVADCMEYGPEEESMYFDSNDFILTEDDGDESDDVEDD